MSTTPTHYCTPDVKDDRLGRVCEDRRKVIGVLLVPAEPHQGSQVVGLVDDGRVLEGSQVKHADAAVGTHRCEDVLCPARPCRTRHGVTTDKINTPPAKKQQGKETRKKERSSGQDTGFDKMEN